MEETIEITKSQLVKAFQKWNEDFKKDFEQFSFEEAGLAEGQAETLIEYLEKTK